MQAFDYVNGRDAEGTSFDYDGTDAGSFDYDGTDAEGFFDFVGDAVHAVGNVASAVGGAVAGAARAVGGVAQKGLHALTSNPIWDIARTGVSFIPGVGTAVSAGMASAAAIGRGESLADVGLAAAKGAIPGGPIAQAAFDVGIGAIRGHNLAAEALKELRSQVPGGELGKGAFDAAVAVVKGLGPTQIQTIRNNQTPQARAQFDAALAAHRSQNFMASAPAVPSHSPDFWIKAKEYADAVKRANAPKRRPPHIKTRHVKRVVRPPNPTRPFPQLGAAPNRVAANMIANAPLRALNVQQLANTVPLADTRDVRSALAAFLTRFGSQEELDWRDVAEYDTIDQAARRCGVECPDDLGNWPGDTEGVSIVQLPPVAVSRSLLHEMYRRGDHNIKKAILAHGLLAHIARNTGELSGTTWTIRSGDNPWKVTQTLTGDGNRWKEIAKVNPNMPVIGGGTALQGWYVGRTFEVPPSWLPTVLPLPQAAAAPVAVIARPNGPPFPAPSQYPNGYPSTSYVVKSGDTGEKIAQMITGDKDRWRELLTTNPKKADPKFGFAIYTGNVITLPSSWVSSVPAIVAPPPPPLLPSIDALPPIGGDPMSHSPTPAPVTPSPYTDVEPGGFSGGLPPHMPPEAAPQPSIQATTIPASVPAPVVPEPSPPTVIGSQEQLGTYQTMLASFFRNHVDASYITPGAPFGSIPDDLAGVWDPRTQSAFAGFAKWWNGQGKSPALTTDGLPTDAIVAALVTQTKDDYPGSSVSAATSTTVASRAPAKPSGGGDVGPLLLLGLLPFLS